jgi:hypothetical protein
MVKQLLAVLVLSSPPTQRVGRLWTCSLEIPGQKSRLPCGLTSFIYHALT